MNILSVCSSDKLSEKNFVDSSFILPRKQFQPSLPLYQIAGDYIQINQCVEGNKIYDNNFNKINPFLIENFIQKKFGANFNFHPNKIMLNNYYYNSSLDYAFNNKNIKNNSYDTFENKRYFCSNTSSYMPETVYFKDEYIFKNNYIAKNVLSKTSLSFLNDSKADIVKCDKHISLDDNANIKKVSVGGGVFLKGKSHVDSIESTKIIYDSETLVSIILRNDSTANTIKAKDGVSLKGNSHANFIDSQKNVYLDENSSAKAITSKNCILKHLSHCQKIKANIVKLENNSSADQIIASKALMINNNAHVNKAKSPVVKFNQSSAFAKSIHSDNNLYIQGNGSIENISVKGTKVVIEGLLHLENKIKFENGSGKVILLRDSHGNFPKISPDKIENGEVIHRFHSSSK